MFNCLLTLHIIYISLPKSSNCRNGLDGCHGSCWEMTSVEEPPTQQEATGSTRSPPHRGYGQYTGSTRSPPTQQEATAVRGALSSSYCPQPEEPPTQQEATGRRPWSERPCGRCRSPPHSKRLRPVLAMQMLRCFKSVDVWSTCRSARRKQSHRKRTRISSPSLH